VLATLTAAGWQELEYAAFIEAIDLDAQRNADNGRTSGIMYIYIYIYTCVYKCVNIVGVDAYIAHYI